MKLQEKISRNNFLKQLGFTGASLLAIYGLDSCVNETGTTPIGNITVDLSAAENAVLKTNGGYKVINSIVVANNNGTYIAATLICSHEGQRQITFSNKEWYCTAHGARFDTNGKGLNSNGNKGLTVYQASLSGNILTINS